MRIAFPSTFFYAFGLMSFMKEGHSNQWVSSIDTACGVGGDCPDGNDIAVMRSSNAAFCKSVCEFDEMCGGFNLAGEFCELYGNAACNHQQHSNSVCFELKQSAAAQATGDPHSAQATGDPHFVTWSGRKYDFHGICDLVLVQNPDFQKGLGLNIYVRTKQLKQYSYISSAVLQVGDESLEVMGDIHKNLYWINKKQGKDTNKEGIVGEINGYEIKYQKMNSKQHEFIIYVVGASITMRTYKNFVHVGVSDAKESSFGSSKGLLGAYGNGQLICRNGSKTFENTDEFGQEWQVLPGDGSWFHEVEGPQAPQKCQIPLTTNIRRRLAESSVGEQDAKLSCAHVDPDVFEMCVFDVMATGDNGVAGAY